MLSRRADRDRRVSRAQVRRFEDLEAWQTARELARGVYRAAENQKLAADRFLCDQMRRAAISVVSNVAEGFERGTRKQQIEFIYVAKGSVAELRAQVIVAADVGLLDTVASRWLLERCETCSRQLQNYVDHLRRTARRFPGPKYRQPAAEEADTR